jgi:hypothetical protein
MMQMQQKAIRVEFPFGPETMNYGQRIRVSKRRMPHLPRRFKPSDMSLSRGARAVYRDSRKRDSLQVRDFGSYWEVELDRFNPEQSIIGFIGHAFTDAPAVTALVALGVMVVVAAARAK